MYRPLIGDFTIVASTLVACTIVAFTLATTPAAAHASAVRPGPVLLCHRTANEDVPENTLESLEQAALLGCNVVELDLRRTLDGKIVLNHDGVLERLTDGVGDVETSFYADLEMRDAGAWMGERFAGEHIALFEDALRLARTLDIRLVLDIKTKDIGVAVLQILQREGMLQRVQFNGEWADIKRLDPEATGTGAGTVWVRAGVTAEQVKQYHRAGKAVIANFSDSKQEMDLAAMKAAVANGVDGINVDYPRLGSDAVGRPVERTLNVLALQANAGESSVRTTAILKLARYRGFPLQAEFQSWLLDPDDHVSRAAAIALLTATPRASPAAFAAALHAPNADARANAAWALGRLQTPVAMLLPLLTDPDPQVLQQTLWALAQTPGEVSAQTLLPLLSYNDAAVRGAAALALARHQPSIAGNAIASQLQVEMRAARILYDAYAKRKPPQLSAAEIVTETALFRCQMKMMQALSHIPGERVTEALETQAFRSSDDFSQMNGVVAAFQLWDRIGADPRRAIAALGDSDPDVADKAEWMLVQAGPAVLPAVRAVLQSPNARVRERAILIVSLQGDTGSLERLRAMRDGPDQALAADAITRIENLHAQL